MDSPGSSKFHKNWIKPDWFAFIWVRLNPDKSDFLYFAPFELASELPLFPVRMKNQVLSPSISARLLGVTLVSDLSMHSQIYAVVKSSYYQLYRLGKIRKQLTASATKTMVHSLVISHLDYANSLLAGLPAYKLKSLQASQDLATRLIYRGRSISTKDARYRLHWLPVQQRIDFQILLMVFDCLTGSAPLYPQETINLHVPGHTGIRSSARILTVDVCKASSRRLSRRAMPREGRRGVYVRPFATKGKLLMRSFTNYAPHTWNRLPALILSTINHPVFKKLIKNHLLSLAFPSFCK